MSQGKQIYYHILRENIKKMHPRLKELAIQAGAYQDSGTILTGPMDTAKFAELIVQECADVAYNTAEGETTYGWMVGNKIKQHFGVEE